MSRKQASEALAGLASMLEEKMRQDKDLNRYDERKSLIYLLDHTMRKLDIDNVRYIRIISEYNTYEDDKYQQLIINYTEEGLLMLKRHSYGGFEELNINNL